MKKNNPVEKIAEDMFRDVKFQEKWNSYLTLFGDDIDTLFGKSYILKIRFAAILSEIMDEKYETSVNKLKGFFDHCETEAENNILNRLIEYCESRIVPPSYPQRSARYNEYKATLLENGFTEAKWHYGRFYRQATEKTAFIINLADEDECITVLYGFASTAAEEWFYNNGADEDNCQLRNTLGIASKSDASSAKEIITRFYQTHHTVSKDELLALKKEKQKKFLDQFTTVLKPLGFKKKAAKWSKDLGQGYQLVFYAQKSAFSDQYYFNVDIRLAADDALGHCFGSRVVMYGRGIYNWQLMSQEQINNLISYTMEKFILPIVNTPLEILGKTEFVCQQCVCRRNKCQRCWVEHNLWGN